MQHMLLVKKSVLPLYGAGKDLEVRTRNWYALQIRVGDTVVLSANELKRRVVAIRCYPDFDSLLSKEDANRIWPGHGPRELLLELRGIYPACKERFGVLVFELALP